MGNNKLLSIEEIKVFADGRTEPKIESGTEILLIQDNSITVGKLFVGEEYEFFLWKSIILKMKTN